LPNLLEHSQKKNIDSSSGHASVVIGPLLGTVVGKLVEISNCFSMDLKKVEK